jgi:hypothetical protein
MVDLTKSLEQLEGDAWGEPTFDSYLVTTAHRLRRKALCEFTVEDLRLMLGQGIGVPLLLPLALDHLEEDPFIEGDFYAGDLLAACVRLDADRLHACPDLRRRLRAIAQRASLEVSTREGVPRDLRGSIDAFLEVGNKYSSSG